MASAPDSSDSRVGTVIADRYRITAKLGEGGMGAVYRGVHESLRKPVALKFMVPSARSDAELAQRFEREAVATANLKHPNISETTDYGQLPDGTLYLVMECIDGKNLRELVADGKLPPARALGIVKQIGAALSFAHASDVVHRDLKPDNVIVFDRGSTTDIVKVIDFGIARMKSSFGGGKTALTQAGTVFGTPDYMAPEQALGQAVDPRADQYALGAIAYELFTGKPPYAADNTAALMFMHVGAPIPRVGDLAPELPPQVSDVVAKMMAKLPDERFVSVDEALAALTRAFDAPASTAPFVPHASTAAFAPQASSPPTVSQGRAQATTKVSPQMPAQMSPAPATLVSPGVFPVTAATAPQPQRRPFPIAWAIAGALLAVIAALGALFLLFSLRQKEAAATSDAADAGDLGVAATTQATAEPTVEPTTTANKPSPSHIKPVAPAAAKAATTTNTTTANAATANAATASTTTPAIATVATPLATTTTTTTAPPAPTNPAPPQSGGPPGHGHGHH